MLRLANMVGSLLFLFAATGCSQRRPADPPSDARFWGPIRPVIHTKTNWTDEHVARQITFARTVFGTAGVEFDILEPRYVDDEALLTIDTKAEYDYICRSCKDAAEEDHELLIWFMHYTRMTWYDSPPLLISWANLPSNPPGSIWQWGIVIGDQSAVNTVPVAHELCHYLGNLQHPRDDGTTSEPDFIDFCNVLHNVSGRYTEPTCFGHWLTARQIREIRAWCNGAPRNLVMRHYDG